MGFATLAVRRVRCNSLKFDGGVATLGVWCVGCILSRFHGEIAKFGCVVCGCVRVGLVVAVYCSCSC